MATTADEVIIAEISAPRSEEVEEPPVVVTKKPSAAPVTRDTEEETRPRQQPQKPPPSSSNSKDKQSYSSSSKQKTTSSVKSSTRSYQSSSSSQPREYRDYTERLGIASLSREFRGTSPSVIENIATHPLLFSPGYEPIRNPHLSARSKKVLRETSELGVVAPGLKALLEVGAPLLVYYLLLL